MTESRKPGVVLWATVMTVVALAGYPLSYGPVCRLVDWELFPETRTHEFYSPLLAVIARSPIYARGVWWILTDRQWRKSKR